MTDEVVVRKRGGKRVEKIDDTVRHTEVDVQDLSQSEGYGAASVTRGWLTAVAASALKV